MAELVAATDNADKVSPSSLPESRLEAIKSFFNTVFFYFMIFLGFMAFIRVLLFDPTNLGIEGANSLMLPKLHTVNDAILLHEYHSRNGVCVPGESSAVADVSHLVNIRQKLFLVGPESFWAERLRKERMGLHKMYLAAARAELGDLVKEIKSRGVMPATDCKNREVGDHQKEWVAYDVRNLVNAHKVMLDAGKDYERMKMHLKKDLHAFDGQFDEDVVKGLAQPDLDAPIDPW